MAESIKTIVIDCSVVMAFILPDEKNTPIAKKLSKEFGSKYKLISPNLLEFETGNALKSAVLSRRITRPESEFLFETFRQLHINFFPIKQESVLRLSLKHNISFYDASYLYLAKANKCELLTLDKKLKNLNK